MPTTGNSAPTWGPSRRIRIAVSLQPNGGLAAATTEDMAYFNFHHQPCWLFGSVVSLVVGCAARDDLNDLSEGMSESASQGMSEPAGEGDVSEEIGAPVFRAPVALGTVLDLSVSDCIHVRVVIDDPDDDTVDISVVGGGPHGAELTRVGGSDATWDWCPSGARLARDRHTIVFAADDGDHDPVLKEYLVVLRLP